MWGVTARREMYSSTETGEKRRKQLSKASVHQKKTNERHRNTLDANRKMEDNRFKCNHISHGFLSI